MPIIDRKKPKMVRKLIFYFRPSQATTPTKRGRVPVIVPARDAEVYFREVASKRKYKQGSQIPKNASFFQSPFRYCRFLNGLRATRIKIGATSNLPKITNMGS